MKFEKFNYEIWKDWIYLLPSIEVRIDDPIYYNYTFAVCVHFLVFHFRWVWMRKERE